LEDTEKHAVQGAAKKHDVLVFS
jgi:hypothetical protein